jgi:hypothetical protein
LPRSVDVPDLTLSLATPTLLGSLTSHAESVADLVPGVADGSQAVDGCLDGVVDVVGQVDQMDQRFDITGGDAATVGAQDAAGEGGAVGVLSDRPRAFWCQGVVDSVLESLRGLVVGAGLAGAGVHGVLLAAWRPTWWASPDRRRSLPGAGAVKGLGPEGTLKMLWPRASLGPANAVLLPIVARPKDLETLDRSRGRLILPRRVKATPRHLATVTRQDKPLVARVMRVERVG